MKRTKYSTEFTLSWDQFEKHTGFSSPNIQQILLFAQHLVECAKEKLNRQGWICMNDIRELFSYPPCLKYQPRIYFKEFGDEPVKVKIAENKLGIVVTMTGYIDLCDEPIK